MRELANTVSICAICANQPSPDARGFVVHCPHHRTIQVFGNVCRASIFLDNVSPELAERFLESPEAGSEILFSRWGKIMDGEA